MKANATTIIIGILLVLAILGAIIWSTSSHPSGTSSAPPHPEPVATAIYACAGGKTISALYFMGGGASSTPDGRPNPTGWVEVAIGLTGTTTLHQTLSADGARYANADESLVFWNKGNEALIMRDNVMDLDYRNCLVR